MKLKLATIGMLAALAAAPALAEQTTTSGAGALSTGANADFEVVVPKFLRFQVGAVGSTINKVTFTLTADGTTIPGDGTDVSGTGGNVGGNGLSVVVKSNSGQVVVTPTNSGTTGLENATAEFIPYTEILTASSDPAVPAPVLTNGPGTGVNVTLGGSSCAGCTNRSATWTYLFDNAAMYSDGTFGGTVARGGQVTYTATAP